MTTPAEPAIKGELVVLPAGQAALFDDPSRLLALTDEEFGVLTTDFTTEAGGLFAKIRRLSGLMAWAAKHRYGEGKRYGEYLSDLGERVGVSNATVVGWRDKVVRDEGLTLPGPLRTGRPPSARLSENPKVASTLAAPPAARPTVSKEEPSTTTAVAAAGASSGPSALSQRTGASAAVATSSTLPAGPDSAPTSRSSVRTAPTPSVGPRHDHSGSPGPSLVLPDFPTAAHVEKVCSWLGARPECLQRVTPGVFERLSKVVKAEVNRRRLGWPESAQGVTERPLERREVQPRFKGKKR